MGTLKNDIPIGVFICRRYHHFQLHQYQFPRFTYLITNWKGPKTPRWLHKLKRGSLQSRKCAVRIGVEFFKVEEFIEIIIISRKYKYCLLLFGLDSSFSVSDTFRVPKVVSKVPRRSGIRISWLRLPGSTPRPAPRPVFIGNSRQQLTDNIGKFSHR